MREIKFRVWDRNHNKMVHKGELHAETYGKMIDMFEDEDLMQYTGIKDKNGEEIYEGDILQFSDKWEWYKNGNFFCNEEEYQEVLNNHVKYPYERREVIMLDCYKWILSSEIQEHWEIVGNIYENPDLI